MTSDIQPPSFFCRNQRTKSTLEVTKFLSSPFDVMSTRLVDFVHKDHAFRALVEAEMFFRELFKNLHYRQIYPGTDLPSCKTEIPNSRSLCFHEDEAVFLMAEIRWVEQGSALLLTVHRIERFRGSGRLD